jgi:hypothetical protein
MCVDSFALAGLHCVSDAVLCGWNQEEPGLPSLL